MVIRQSITSIMIFFLAISLMGMARTKIDLSQDPKYSSFVRKKYKTKSDLVIYKMDGSKETILGIYGDDVPEKEEMKDKFPFRYYARKILGILPKDSVFEIIGVTEEGSHTLTFTYYQAKIISSSNEEFVLKTVNSTFLADTNRPPRFKPELVQEVDEQ